MAKEKFKPTKKKVFKPMTAEELGPTGFTDPKDYEEQVAFEAKAKAENK